MSKVYVFLADGFEEVEALMVVDMLRRAKIEVNTISIMGELQIQGRSKIEVKADLLFEDVTSFDDADMLILPGGMPGTTYLGEYQPLTKLLLDFNSAGKKIAAICAAPTILGKLGILDGKDATCYPGLEDQLGAAKWSDKKAVIDDNVTTSRGLGTSITFSLKLIEQLAGKEMAENVGKEVVFLHKWA